MQMKTNVKAGVVVNLTINQATAVSVTVTNNVTVSVSPE